MRVSQGVEAGRATDSSDEFDEGKKVKEEGGLDVERTNSNDGRIASQPTDGIEALYREDGRNVVR